jgi:hypothetical protein
MSMTVAEFKDNLSAMLHGGTLNKVRNFDAVMQRSANVLLSKIDPIDTIRTVALANTVHDDIYNYSLPSDYRKLIDLIPQNKRETSDMANRNLAQRFDVRKKLADKTISIEGSEGTKIIRINWRSRQPKVLNEVNSVTANGTWAIVGTASGLVADEVDYVSGSGSLRFDIGATGDGIQNTSMSAVDLSDEDEVADFFVWFKVKNAADLANLNSVTLVWGNDLTTAYWTGTAQTTQADGTAFKVGWNQIKVPWSTATETGTVAPSTIDSARVTFNVDAAISDIRVDNITCSIGRNFDIKYYSKFLLQNSTGTWITKTTSDDDSIVLDSDAIYLYQLETLIAAAHQMEGSDSTFDISFAKGELDTLYKRYKAEYPSQALKALSYYGEPTTRRHW